VGERGYRNESKSDTPVFLLRPIIFMRLFKIILLIVFFTQGSSCYAQSKFYLSAGKAAVSGTGTNLLFGTNYAFKLAYFNFDFEYQRRILGSISTVAGLSVFNAGYNAKEIGFSSQSDFKARYIAMPLMARWSPKNRNSFFVDLGLVPFYLLNAHLKESVDQFNTVRTVEGDIAKYSNRLYYGYKLQMLFQINRYHVGFYFFAPFHGQSSLKGLENHWGLSAQESTYLLSNGFRDFYAMGLKAGVRIR
jgi:hypothetical protein